MQKKPTYLGDMSTAGLKQFAKAMEVYVATGKIDEKKYPIFRVTVPAKPAEVRKVRKTLSLDRSELAAALGVSKDTVKGWEIGKRVPDGPATKLLRYLKTNPGQVPAFVGL